MSDLFLLSNGIKIPALGMGTYPLNGQVLSNAVHDAYDCGYRLFDTADNYYNEEDLGKGLQTLYDCSDAKREELFLVSKLSEKINRVRLMHWPYPDFFEEIWYEMENLYKEGYVRAIGVCNCRERHFEKLRNNCTVFPMVNQFESSPLNTKQSLTDYCKNNGVHVMIYSPLMNLRIKSSRAYIDYLEKLATKYQKTKAQIVLRFDVQRGFTPIPKSAHKERLRSNIDIFDFTLTEEEIKKLLSFNEDRQTLPESKSCPGL